MNRKINTLILFALISISLIGCGVTTEQMIKETQGYNLPVASESQKGYSLIYVVRPNALGTLIRFNVFVDNKSDDSMEAGFTRGNQYIYFFTRPGTHMLYSKAENTAEFQVNTEAGKTYFIEQVPSMGFIMARNSLVMIDEVKGKYSVMKSEEGTMKKKMFD